MNTKQELNRLIDLLFQIALMLSTPGIGRDGKKYDLTKWPIPKKAEWIANQLRECGYPTHPVGMCWGVLDKDFDNKKLQH